MGTRSAPGDRGMLELSVDLDWRRPATARARRMPRRTGEQPSRVRPLRGRYAGHLLLADPANLPFGDGSLRLIVCTEALEFVRDDERLIDEIARVLAPGGDLVLVVPNAGRLAGVDAYNLGHYLVDVTKRGARPPEVSEIGWRRHYVASDLASLLRSDRFATTAATTRGFVVAETLSFLAMVLFRWLAHSPRRDDAAQRAVRAMRRWEERLPFPGGNRLVLTARRLPEAIGPAGNAPAAGSN